MNERLGLAFRTRRMAGPLTLLTLIFALLIWAPGALATGTVLDGPATDGTAAVDATAGTDTTTSVETAVTAVDVTPPADAPPAETPAPVDRAAPSVDPTPAPDPAPTAEAPPAVPDAPPIDPAPPVVEAPVVESPVAAVTPDPTPVLGDTVLADPVLVDPVPTAPADLIVAIQDAVSTPAGDIQVVTATGADSPAVTSDISPAASTDLGSTPLTTLEATPPADPGKAPESPLITPMVVPITDALSGGLFAADLHITPLDRFGAPIPPTPTQAAAMAAAVAEAATTHAEATPGGGSFILGAIQGGGLSNQSIGVLALLMGVFLPFGLPGGNGKGMLGGQTQLAVLMVGALLLLVRFFLTPIRDERRRGPRGFAALALRPG